MNDLIRQEQSNLDLIRSRIFTIRGIQVVPSPDRRQIAGQAKNDANQIRNEERFKLILDAMHDKTFPPQKVFFDGQIYDAFEQMKKFVT